MHKDIFMHPLEYLIRNIQNNNSNIGGFIMEEKKVVVTLGKDGSVKVEAFGFKGGHQWLAIRFLRIGG